MKQIVVTCHGNGTVETLLKDSVFDTRGYGDRKIERLSQIGFDENNQVFYVEWLKGPDATVIDLARFTTYEAAVEFEIAEVNRLRLEGHSFV